MQGGWRHRKAKISGGIFALDLRRVRFALKGSLQNAAVVGAGPNGLAGAITLAQAGMAVTVYEAESIAGGGARTIELTLPGFRHDFGSAVHPMAVGSPFFRRLPLAAHGLEWIHSPVAMAHPLDDGTAALLVRDLDEQCRLLGKDGNAWRRILEPFSRNWWALTKDILQPLSPLPRHPLLACTDGCVRGTAGIHAGAAGVSECAYACALCRDGGALISQPDAAFQQLVRHCIGSSGACRGLADSKRWVAGYYGCDDRAFAITWRCGANFDACRTA